ncbi:enolase C-terminal domain-like protein [Blastochloris viridis]|uniref:O-succinylbenzoate synthase n=1 Tax=Blastochloris viridis TaxID=1079 RepID=A0A182CXV2_BLAVI|nr:enolase C-terminal domain-like protein [Blastochloris viridis]ALK08705.1 L-Ala-D/L-Glu epimerase [Blastochloris viridis]BAR97999.1 O-succinylbenzoate synthase [Blastochloris viridis]
MTSPLRLFLEAPRRVEAARVVVRGTLRTREAVRIALRDSGGGVGHGEALPLPGYSADTALQAELALAAAAARARTVGGLALPDDGLAPAAYLNAALVPFDTLLTTTPSARFALECALLGLLAGRAGVSAAQWLAGRRALHQVAVSVLLPDDDSAVAAAGAAAARGHTVLKLKIALPGRSAADEEARIAAVRAAADAASRPGAVRLRLDANGALPPAEVAARLAALAGFGIELVEEPCPAPALRTLPLPWAADESLADPALAAALLARPPGRGPAALVLKPATLGLARCLDLADAANARGLGVIVTHAFDGDLGFAAARALAAALPAPPLPCGLAPHPGLSRRWPNGPVLAAPTAAGLDLPEATVETRS